LIREITFLAEYGDKKVSGYGKRLLGEVKKMYRRMIEEAAGCGVPKQEKAKNLSKKDKGMGRFIFYVYR
jgi:hypothetical protein